MQAQDTTRKSAAPGPQGPANAGRPAGSDERGPPGRPGRPATGAARDVRRALLDAARDLLVEVGFDRATLKAIGERAGVNAAMIHYYFGSKEGLSRAVLHDAVGPLLDRLGAANASDADGMSLADVLEAYVDTLAANPRFPQLVVREVLPENGRLRGMFVDELSSRARELLPRIVAREQAAGRVRADLEPELVVVSLLSLAVFPFVAAPVLDRVLDISVDRPADVERLKRQALDVLQRGLMAPARESS